MLQEMSVQNIGDIFSLWKEAEHKLQRACAQLDLLNARLEKLHRRLDKARSAGPLAYNLRMEVSVVEGVRGMFYQYAHSRAQDVAYLWQVMSEHHSSSSILQQNGRNTGSWVQGRSRLAKIKLRQTIYV